ncbi:MAG: hypothetical protein QOJ09_2030 [Actinomycetota bacterium]|nr:hypothetical protein [Actinomycetota bacterium]
MDRRAVFFLVAAGLAFALTPVADPQHRWVAITTGSTYVVLALLATLDSWSRRKDEQ